MLSYKNNINTTRAHSRTVELVFKFKMLKKYAQFNLTKIFVIKNMKMKQNHTTLHFSFNLLKNIRKLLNFYYKVIFNTSA